MDGQRAGEVDATHPSANQREWQQWHSGVPLEVLHTEYASIVRPVTEFVDRLRQEREDRQIVVLIPVIEPPKLRYRILHNQLDVALSSALRTRTDLIVARVPMSLAELADAPSDRTEDP
jgi:hypothetical protein